MDLLNYLNELQENLNVSVKQLRKSGEEYANAYKEYRIALAKQLVVLKDRNIPATLCGDLARGDSEVANKKYEEIRTEAIYRANLESINSLKIQIKVVENQLEREWRNE